MADRRLSQPGIAKPRAAYTYKAYNHAELRSCVKVEVAVLGSASLIVLMVSVDVTQH